MGKLNGIFVATDDEVEAEISSIRLDIFKDAYCRCESTMNLRSTVNTPFSYISAAPFKYRFRLLNEVEPSGALRLWTPCSHLDP